MEEYSPIKHEYIDGYIYAMVGANDADVTIAGDLFALLRSHLRVSNEQSLWVLQSYTEQQETFQLESIDFAGTIAALYEDVTFAMPTMPTFSFLTTPTWQP
jgi:hypothetical protein